jgi:ABC-type sulfate transport system substrate-binding protein
MDRTRIIFVVIILLAVCAVGAFFGFQYISDLTGQPDTAARNDDTVTAVDLPRDAVLVTLASSNTKRAWLDQVTAEFNAAEMKTSAGSTIVVETSHVTSGGSMNSILDGSLQPIAWSPGDQSWVSQANDEWQRQNNPFIANSRIGKTIFGKDYL